MGIPDNTNQSSLVYIVNVDFVDLWWIVLFVRSAFFFFCGDERPEVRAAHPEWSVAEVAKELGKRWEKVTNKSKYEARAEADKARYAKVGHYSFHVAEHTYILFWEDLFFIFFKKQGGFLKTKFL